MIPVVVLIFKMCFKPHVIGSLPVFDADAIENFLGYFICICLCNNRYIDFDFIFLPNINPHFTKLVIQGYLVVAAYSIAFGIGLSFFHSRVLATLSKHGETGR